MSRDAAAMLKKKKKKKKKNNNKTRYCSIPYSPPPPPSMVSAIVALLVKCSPKILNYTTSSFSDARSIAVGLFQLEMIEIHFIPPRPSCCRRRRRRRRWGGPIQLNVWYPRDSFVTCKKEQSR